MKRETLKSDILELIGGHTGDALSSRQIGEALNVPGKAAKRVQKALNELVLQGAIVRIRGNHYTMGAEADLFTGWLRVARSGLGIVTSDAGEDVFVPSDDLHTAMPGDRVVVRLNPLAKPGAEAPARREGKVIRILERGQVDIVGTLRRTERFLFVVPLDPVYRQNIYVPESGGASVGDRVIVRFTGWDNRHVNPEGEIAEVLGPADKPSVDTLSVIRQFQLPDAFPDEVLLEARSAARHMTRPGTREDLRGTYILTIDPERARDFDDALSLGRDERGRRVLGVHIADVSHFVRTGSALDREARGRGNSVYLPDKVLPMLPEQLSNGVCSLNPQVDRLTFSAFLTFDDRGTCVARRFARSTICSRSRLTYEQAMAMLKDGAAPRPAGLDEEGLRLLRDLHALAQELRAARFARYALDLDVPEVEIQINPEGVMTGIRVVPNDVSHQLVEECMVAANEAVASELRDNGVPSVYRIHEPPSEERIELLTTQLIAMGCRPGDLSHRKSLAMFLKKAASDPFVTDIRVAVLRSMNRAVYSAECSEHYGLAKGTYTHFTSPIRRYPDLLVHRQLAALLANREGKRRDRSDYTPQELTAAAVHCSATERVADDAERTLTEIKTYRFLEAQIASDRREAYEAVVSNVLNFGMFVELPALQVQGLVHVSRISDRFVRFDREKQALDAGGEVFRRGQRVRVRVERVDFDSRKIDFVLAETPAARRPGGR